MISVWADTCVKRKPSVSDSTKVSNSKSYKQLSSDCLTTIGASNKPADICDKYSLQIINHSKK